MIDTLSQLLKMEEEHVRARAELLRTAAQELTAQLANLPHEDRLYLMETVARSFCPRCWNEMSQKMSGPVCLSCLDRTSDDE